MRKIILILAAVNLLLLSACKKQDEVKNDTSIPVNIYQVRPDTIASFIKLTGSVTGGNDAMVYSKISEKLDKIFVGAGQKVAEGQVLAVQYNVLYKQSVDLAAASVKTAQAHYELTESDFARMEELYKQKALSPQQYDQVKAQRKTAEAGLEQAKLQLKQAEENYQNSFIKAPFEGIVGAVFFERDQMIPAGQPVVQVVSPGAMKSKLQLSGKDISKVSIGQPVLIKFPAIPGKEYSGKVTAVNHSLDRLSNLLEIEVQLLRPDKNIKSGLFGEFLIETSNKSGIIVLPENALMQRTELSVDKNTGMQRTIKKHFVFAINNSKAKLKEVKTGINSNGRIEIVNGLSLNDTVIVVGQNIVRDGQKVRVVD